jgi:hypothetical protein
VRREQQRQHTHEPAQHGQKNRQVDMVQTLFHPVCILSCQKKVAQMPHSAYSSSAIIDELYHRSARNTSISLAKSASFRQLLPFPVQAPRCFRSEKMHKPLFFCGTVW